MPSPSKRVARKRQAARDEIVASAWSILDEQGIDALTADSVAAHAGISKASVFYYFGSMPVLLRELIASELAGHADDLRGAVDAAADPVEAVGRVVRAVFGRYRDAPERFKLIAAVPLMQGGAAVGLDQGEVQRTIDPPFIAYVDAFVAKLRGWAMPDGADPRRMAVAIHMAGIGAVLLCHTMRATGGGFRAREQELVDELAKMLERGMEPGR